MNPLPAPDAPFCHPAYFDDPWIDWDGRLTNSERDAILLGTVFDRSSPNQLARERAARLVIDAIEERSGIDGRLIVESFVATIWFRFLLTGEPLDDDVVERLVATSVGPIT